MSSTTRQTRPDHLVVRLMTDADKPEVAELFASTFQREPLGAYCGVTVNEGRGVAEASMVDPVSFVVEDPTLAGPKRLIAFRTSSILTKARLATDKAATAGDDDDPVQEVLGHMKDLWLTKTTVFTTNPDAKVMKFIALGVDARYEGLGLAKELLNLAMEFQTKDGRRPFENLHEPEFLEVYEKKLE
ncbi:hypothetical protein BG000_008125 [Podila horticola]|nr:hypothetical protein BG000_008125 [Podila horticola]